MTAPGAIGGTTARLRWEPQTRTAVLTIAWVYAATLCVFVTTMALRGQLTGKVFWGVAVPMMLEAFPEILAYLILRATLGRPWVRWPALVAFGLADSIAAAAWDTQLRQWAGLLRTDYMNTSFLNGIVRAIPVDFYHTGLLIALFVFQEAYFQLRDHQRRLVASQASERGAHLAALRLQLNPHFLFNSMNALSSLVVTGRTGEAESMIERLSAFLRATLTSDPSTLVRLDEEFETLESYLDVERVRFGDRLHCRLDLPGALEAVRVPPFLLQPLVENAVKYAVAPSRRPVTVTVSARSDGERLTLAVEDDGEGCEAVAGGTGVGLANVRQRLALEYGGAASLQARCLPSGFRAVITIPAGA